MSSLGAIGLPRSFWLPPLPTMTLPDLIDLDWDSATTWLRDLDWGSVPAWAGALSLWLAFTIFRRDRRNAERAQVDLVGAWGTTEYERRFPDAPGGRVKVATARLYVRNASTVPVLVELLTCKIETSWLVPDGRSPRSYQRTAGVRPEERAVKGIVVEPDGKWGSPEGRFDLKGIAPEGAAQLDPVDGVRCVVRGLMLLDNAGRRWVVRPGKGRRAAKVGWYRYRRLRRRLGKGPAGVLWDVDWS